MMGSTELQADVRQMCHEVAEQGDRESVGGHLPRFAPAPAARDPRETAVLAASRHQWKPQ